MSYSNLSDNEKKSVIEKRYVQKGESFAEIAKHYDTYANRIRRDAQKYNIPIRSKSEAQKNVLEKGKSQHPTKGKTRTYEEKVKIGKSIYESWQNLSEADLTKRKLKSKAIWDGLSQNEKENRLNAAHTAIRESSKKGSKLEHFLMELLIEKGYKVEFHKEQILSNTKLQIDIYLPALTTAIEVDGPSHFEPVWGEDTLNKNQKYDQKKTGLIIGRGMRLVRVKQSKDFSPTRARIIFDKLHTLLQDIDNRSEKTFNIED
jgi:very-short-patch-repair endonuclease